MTDADRTILITGATSGLGRELARRLATRPGHLILHGRSPDKLAELHQELEGSEAVLESITADLADLTQVGTLSDAVAELTDRLDVLVNNAGIGPGSDDTRELSADGYELRLAVNHLAPFALTLRLLPLLEVGAPSRIVNVASGAQQIPDLDDLHLEHAYTGSRAYAQSKLAMIATGIVLAGKLLPDVVTVNSLHPATLMPTPLVAESYGHTIDDLDTGATATMRLIEAEELDGVTGTYFTGTQESRADETAYDAEFQRRLWEISEELTDTRL